MTLLNDQTALKLTVFRPDVRTWARVRVKNTSVYEVLLFTFTLIFLKSTLLFTFTLIFFEINLLYTFTLKRQSKSKTRSKSKKKKKTEQVWPYLKYDFIIIISHKLPLYKWRDLMLIIVMINKWTWRICLIYIMTLMITFESFIYNNHVILLYMKSAILVIDSYPWEETSFDFRWGRR